MLMSRSLSSYFDKKKKRNRPIDCVDEQLIGMTFTNGYKIIEAKDLIVGVSISAI